MSSFYHIFDDIAHTEAEVVDRYKHHEVLSKNFYFAALRIQKYFRGYLVRKALKKKHASATTIQKMVRGWRVRFHLPDILHEHYDFQCLVHYNKSATKIQALWKGYKCRLKINIKHILKQKEHMEEMKELVASEIRQAFEENEYLGTSDMEKTLNVLYDKHHLLRTQRFEGIFSQHGSKELSEIEKILQSIPWKNHMEEVRKCYKKCQKERPYNYVFDCKKLRKDEDLYRLRDRSKDPIYDYTDFTETRENNFISKLEKKKNLGSLIDTGPYSSPIRRVLRTVDKSKNISEHDFDLSVMKMIAKEADIPPYYIDFWYGKCENHNLPE